jgi:hypothetical protein
VAARPVEGLGVRNFAHANSEPLCPLLRLGERTRQTRLDAIRFSRKESGINRI